MRLENHPNYDFLFGLGALRDMSNVMGSGVSVKLMLQACRYLYPVSVFDDFLEALVQADLDLYAGIHETILRRLWWFRGLFGSQPQNPWPPVALETPHSYTDDYDQTQSHTIPGASALRVTFHGSTRVWWGGNASNRDLIYVMDGNGTNIPGSPFDTEVLGARTVVVPGDTVQIRLYSMPSNNRVAFGYRVINVVADDPTNVLPIADLRPSRTIVNVPFVVRFDAGHSRDPDGSIIAYELDPGDGSDPIRLDPGVPWAEHIYNMEVWGPQPLVVTATLTVTDDGGYTASTSVPVEAYPYDWGQPASAFAFGSGCGVPALTLSDDAPPAINTTARATLTNLPSAIAALSLGFSRTTFGPFALPLSLTPLGMTGCDLLQSADLQGLPVTSTGPGTAAYEVPIPNLAVLVGGTVYLQGVALAPGANPANVILSNGLEWNVGL